MRKLFRRRVSILHAWLAGIKKTLASCFQQGVSMQHILAYGLTQDPKSPKREVTEAYPDPVSARTSDDLPARTRGFLKNNIQTCTGCFACEQACPTGAIQMAAQKEDRGIKMWVSFFSIDHTKCIYCGLCAEVCPPQSIVHEKEYNQVFTNVSEGVKHFGKGDLPKATEVFS